MNRLPWSGNVSVNPTLFLINKNAIPTCVYNFTTFYSNYIYIIIKTSIFPSNCWMISYCHCKNQLLNELFFCQVHHDHANLIFLIWLCEGGRVVFCFVLPHNKKILNSQMLLILEIHGILNVTDELHISHQDRNICSTPWDEINLYFAP